MDSATRINQLRDEIRHHEERYYIHTDPEITDDAFDALLKELEALEAATPGPRHCRFTDAAGCRASG